jgi:hypothetical protein
MNTITLPAPEAVRAAAALVVHAATDDVTPTIMSAGLQVEGDVTFWCATDRFTAARWRCSTKLEGDEFIVPRDALLWIKGIKETSVRVRNWWGSPVEGGGYGIRITEEDTGSGVEVVVELFVGEKVERSQRFFGIKGNFPPVSRLFPERLGDTVEGIPSKVVLKQETLKKAIDNLTALAEGKAKEAIMVFHLQPSIGSKPAPLVYAIGSQFDALLQPNLLK